MDQINIISNYSNGIEIIPMDIITEILGVEDEN